MQNVREALFRIGRVLGKHPLTSTIFCLVERALPLQRLGRTDHAVAFAHPRPSWDPHILVVPTIPFPTLLSTRLSQERKAALLWEALRLAHQCSLQIDASAPWQVIFNGGQRQDIGQVHGHLVQSALPLPGVVATVQDPSKDPNEWRAVFEQLELVEHPGAEAYSLIFTRSHGDCFTAHISA